MKEKNNKIDLLELFVIYFKAMLNKTKLKMILWMILSIISSLIPSLIIILNRNIINGIKEEQILKVLVLLLMLVATAQLINSLIDIFSSYLYESIKKVISHDIYIKLYKKMTTIPLEKFEDNEYYDTVMMAERAVEMNGIDNIKDIIDIIKNIITISSVILILSVIHWSLSLGVILSMVPGFIGTIIAKSMQYNNRLALVSSERMQSYTSALFFNKNFLKENRIFKIEKYLINKWSEIFNYVESNKIKILIKENKISFIGNSVIQISTVLVNIYLIYNIYLNNITLGDYVALTGAITVLQSEIGNIAMNVGNLVEFALYNESLFKIINENNIEIQNKIDEPISIQSLELKKVSFKYPKSNKFALRNISLQIKKGQKIAIVGYNGSGKSTLINILLGNYTNIVGEYKINNEKINNLTASKYQQKMTVILQDFIRYKLSIRDNIAFGNLKYINDDELIINKLKEVNLENEVNELSNNIDTILSNEFTNGTELSGGQWQKIAIARAMIKDSEIVIFDEPTSALDPIAELEIFSLLNEVSEDKTTIMISHRLGITRFADTIILMKDGQIIEKGSHEELMDKNGEYRAMYEAQAEYYNI